MSNKLKSRVANPLFQVILRSGEVVISNNNLKSQETECHVIATNIIKNRPIHYSEYKQWFEKYRNSS